MRALFLTAIFAATSCQRSSPIDLEIVGLTKGEPQQLGPADVTPVQVTTPNIEPPWATAALTITPNGMVKRTDIAAVNISVDVGRARGGELALEVIAPDGTMYQRLIQEVAVDPDATQHFDFVIPVAGTWIDNFALDGRWDAHLYLRDTEMLHEQFDLNP